MSVPMPRQYRVGHADVAIHVACVAIPIGVIIGVAIAAYDHVVNTLLWETLSSHLQPEVLCLMPTLGMLITGGILKVFKVSSPAMADEVVKAYHEPSVRIDTRAALPKLAASVSTIGLGASAGMEGASKWLGATIASSIQEKLNSIPWLKWTHGKVETTMLAGGAAGIGAIFRAPLTGAIMGIESPYRHDLAHEALIHGLVASATSFATFSLLKGSTPYFPLSFHYTIHIRDLVLCLPLGILAGFLSHIFLATLNGTKKVWRRIQAPILVKYLVGGVSISAVAFASLRMTGTPATLQAGLPYANQLLNGAFPLHICLILLVAKILATSLTFGAGGVGGLFVPSAMIGAAFGAACDILMAPSQPGLFTLVGIAAFTGASYNSLLFAAVFVAEATGSPALVVPGLLASSAAFLVSAGVSNSTAQRAYRHKTREFLSNTPCHLWMTPPGTLTKPKGAVTPSLYSTSSLLEAEKVFLETKNDSLPVIEASSSEVLGYLFPRDVLKARRSLDEDDEI